MTHRFILCAATATLLSACASHHSMMHAPYSQEALPAAVKVPDGHKVMLESVGIGQIAYECKEKAGVGNGFEWAFVGPDAMLNSRTGQSIGKYYGPPATWEAKDGSRITGTQVAVSPATAGSIPYQLVKANPAMGDGAMKGVTYIQRVNTQGGIAPSNVCAAENKGQKQMVKYQADYIFYSGA